MRRLTDHEQSESKNFLKEVLGLTTVNPPGEERLLAEFLAEYSRRHGLQSMVLSENLQRANVKVSLPGERKNARLILNGHLDTVPVGDPSKWNTNPYVPEESNGRVYCRGASDMKGGLCAMLYAMKILKEENYTPAETIHFYGTYDEESMGLGAAQIASEISAEKDALLFISEPTGNEVSIASKGAIWLEVKSTGKTAHGAYSEEGINAIESLLEFISEMKSLLPDGTNEYLGKNTLQLTMVSGGVKTNVIPDHAMAHLDIRLIPETDGHWFLEEMNMLLEDFNARGKAVITMDILNYRDPVSVKKDHAAVKLLQRAHEETTGEAAKICGTNFFSDASIFRKTATIPTVLYGPGEMREAHIPNESLDLDKYYQAITTYYELMKNYKRWEEGI